MSDLRRSATEAKRDHDHKAKWARGARQNHSSRGEQLDWQWADSPARMRPVLPPSSATQSALKRYNEPALRSARQAVSTRFQHDVKEALSSDSSSDEAVHALFAAADGHAADDAALSPYAISGNTILSTAISKAEIKYENKVVEKLVKEYEFVSKEDESSIGYVADVDDFEIIDHVAA